MGQALALAEPKAADVFQQADEILGFGLSKLCWEGPEEALNATENTQPALLVHSVAVWTVFQDRLPRIQTGRPGGPFLGRIQCPGRRRRVALR